jgi:hypothetical protein
MSDRINVDSHLTRQQASVVAATDAWVRWLETDPSFDVGPRKLFESGYRAALTVREEAQGDDKIGETWTPTVKEALTDLLAWVQQNTSNYSDESRDNAVRGAIEALAAREDTERPKHEAGHRVEWATSGMSARCLDCDWSYEYD